MEAPGPSVETKQSTSQVPQESSKRYPNPIWQNHNPSPTRLNGPTIGYNTNRYNHNAMFTSYQNGPSTSADRFHPIPKIMGTQGNNPITFPMNTLPGPFSSKKSPEHAAAAPKKTPEEVLRETLKITVRNDVNPPARTGQSDAIASPSVVQNMTIHHKTVASNVSMNSTQPDRPPAVFFQLENKKQSPKRKVPTFVFGEPSNQHWPIWKRGLFDFSDQDNLKVIVTGFPAYTKPSELVRHLAKLGRVQVKLCKNRVAVVVFETELEAIEAVKANETIPVYGTILNILKYTSRKHVMDLIKANKRVVTHAHKGPPIADPTDIDLSGDFLEQLRNIEDAIRLTKDEVAKINPLFQDIENYMRMIFPYCEAIPFGSITTGQGIKSSDADCFLALRPSKQGRPGLGAAEHCGNFVNRAARLLRVYPKVFSEIVAIPKANTPIIKFLHLPTNINCDLNSKTPLGVQNSRLIGHLLNADGEGRYGSVALFLKYWARIHDLSGTGRLTNYALLLMLLAYLQRTVLPSVVSLQSSAHSFVVENWEAGFDRASLPKPDFVPTVRDILGGFFLHYAGFNFDELVVCPLLGKPLRKVDFENDNLPAQLALYQYNVRERLAYPLRTDRCICIQDPFELSHNVGSSISSRHAARIKANITLAAAAYTQGDKTKGDFIRTILLTRPPSPENCIDTHIATRVSLPARLLAQLGSNWRQVARTAILQYVYLDMLFIQLNRRDAVSRDAEVEIEVYVGNVERPIWRRGRHSNARCSAPWDMLVRHREITQHILDTPNMGGPDVRVPFEVELGFREEPRGLSVTTTAMDGAEPDAFRLFRQFAHTFIHRWIRELLKPHLPCDNSESPERADSPQEGKQAESKSRKSQNVRSNRSKERDAPIETVAFVNSNHKDLSESLAAISLIDNCKKDTVRDNDAT